MREVQHHELKGFVSNPACKKVTCTAKKNQKHRPHRFILGNKYFQEKKKSPGKAYKVTCPCHKSNPQVCPQVTHSFGMPMISGQENATEELKSTLVRTDAHSDAVSATSNHWSHEKKAEALEMEAFSFYWKTLHLKRILFLEKGFLEKGSVKQRNTGHKKGCCKAV